MKEKLCFVSKNSNFSVSRMMTKLLKIPLIKTFMTPYFGVKNRGNTKIFVVNVYLCVLMGVQGFKSDGAVCPLPVR